MSTAGRAILDQAVGTFYEAEDTPLGSEQTVASRITGTDLLTVGSTTSVDADDFSIGDDVGGRRYWGFDGAQYGGLSAADATGLPGAAGAGDCTVVVCFSTPVATSQFGRIWSSESNNNNGMFIRTANGSSDVQLGIGAGTNVGFEVMPFSLDSKTVAACVVSAGTFYGYLHNGSTSSITAGDSLATLTAPTHTTPALGRRPSTTSVSQMFQGRIYALRYLPGVVLTKADLDEVAATMLAADYDAPAGPTAPTDVAVTPEGLVSFTAATPPDGETITSYTVTATVVGVSGTVVAPLGGLTATAAGAVTTPAANVSGAVAAPLGGLTATAAGTVVGSTAATAAAPLGGLTAIAAATRYVSATLAAPLGALTATAAGTATSPGDVSATVSVALGGLTVAVSATGETPTYFAPVVTSSRSLVAGLKRNTVVTV